MRHAVFLGAMTFSVALHAAVLLWTHGGASERLTAPEKSFVVMRLSTTAQPTPRDSDAQGPVRRSSAQNAQSKQISTVRNQQTQVERKELTHVEQVAPDERLSEHTNVSERATDVQQTSVESESAADINPGQTLAETLSPCRSLSLPRHWLAVRQLLPRRYTVEFVLAEHQEELSFRIVKLIPEGDELPFADQFIRNSFERCVNKLSETSLLALHERFRTLKIASANAYSVGIEFQTVESVAGQNKGI